VGGMRLKAPLSPSATAKTSSVKHHPILNKRWATRADGVTAIKLWASSTGHTFIIEPHTKGGRNFKMVCKERLKKVVIAVKVKGGLAPKMKEVLMVDDDVVCKAQIPVVRSKAGRFSATPWSAQTKNTELNHKNCFGSGGKMTRREVVMSAPFQQAISSNKAASSKSLIAVMKNEGFDINASLAYRARDELGQQENAAYSRNFQLLAGWRDAFNANKANGLATLHVDNDNRFKSMTVVLGPSAKLLIESGQNVTMLDMTHSKHKWFRGQHVGLVGTDGDNRITLIAWGLCPAENIVFYKSFFDDIVAWEGGKLKSWMNVEDHVQLSDRFKGIPTAQQYMFPEMLSKNCTKHLLGNMRADKSVANTVRVMWCEAVRRAHTYGTRCGGARDRVTK
jgi:hypothetical protein